VKGVYSRFMTPNRNRIRFCAVFTARSCG